METDEQLMTAYGKGDNHAFANLYQRHKGPLYRYFVRQLNSGQQSRAEELYQEVWCKVIDKRHSYAASAKFTTWLYRIAHNLLIDEHRKGLSEQNYQAQLEEEPLVQDRDPATRNKAAIQGCVALLAPLQQEAFLLRYDCDFEPAQICTIVDAKPEAVKTRLRYALQQLRECLTRKLGGQQ